MEAFFIAASQLIELHRVLCKKRDPLTHTVFASIWEADDGVTDAARSGGDSARGAIRGGGAGGTVDHAGGEGGRLWECADASLLASQPMLASLVSAQPGDAGDGSSLAHTAAEQRHHGAGETRASGVARTPLASGEDAVDGDGGVPPVLSSNPRGLFALYSPLARSLRSAIEAGCSSAPFVRACLASELPRLLELLLVAAERCEEQLLPSALPPEAEASLCAESLLACLGALRDTYRRDLSAALHASCELQLGSISAGGVGAGAAGGAAGGAAADVALGLAIATELRRCAGLPPLYRLVVSAGAQAVGLFAHQVESIVFHSSAAAAGGGAAADEADDETRAFVNGALLRSVKALRADVHQAVDEQTSEEMIAPLRLSLAQLNAPVAALANPSTPLPDELRGDAARLLKVVLRREMIDAEEEEVS